MKRETGAKPVRSRHCKQEPTSIVHWWKPGRRGRWWLQARRPAWIPQRSPSSERAGCEEGALILWRFFIQYASNPALISKSRIFYCIYRLRWWCITN